MLAQAHAAGLPIVTTQNCSGPDLIEHGMTGWIVPARDLAAMSEYLLWCHQNRAEVAEISQMISKQQHIRSWDDMARDYLAAIVGRLAGGVDRPEYPQSSEFPFHAS